MYANNNHLNRIENKFNMVQFVMNSKLENFPNDIYKYMQKDWCKR